MEARLAGWFCMGGVTSDCGFEVDGPMGPEPRCSEAALLLLSSDSSFFPLSFRKAFFISAIAAQKRTRGLQGVRVQCSSGLYSAFS